MKASELIKELENRGYIVVLWGEEIVYDIEAELTSETVLSSGDIRNIFDGIRDKDITYDVIYDATEDYLMAKYPSKLI